jgi:acyl-CoA reductase-like NAD-dependent aldehyde dehydrogenase
VVVALKRQHKINHGWVRPSSPLHSDAIGDRYEGEVATAVRKADKAHRKAQKALERAERRFDAKPDPDTRTPVDDLRAEVERRFLELRELEVQMQQGPSTGTNRSGKGSVRNPLPKGTKL